MHVAIGRFDADVHNMQVVCRKIASITSVSLLQGTGIINHSHTFSERGMLVQKGSYKSSFS